MSKQKIKNHLLLESMVQSIKGMQTIQDEIITLLQVNDLLYNVFLISKDKQRAILETIQNDNIVSETNSSVQVLPVTQDEKHTFFLSEMGQLLEKLLPLDDLNNFNDALELTFSLVQSRRFLYEEIPIFLSYLFNPNDSSINFDQKLSLYLILAEEYHKTLQGKDITSMAILGQKTIHMIIDTIYTRIESHPDLMTISKDKLSILMKKFFVVLNKTVQKIN